MFYCFFLSRWVGLEWIWQFFVVNIVLFGQWPNDKTMPSQYLHDKKPDPMSSKINVPHKRNSSSEDINLNLLFWIASLHLGNTLATEYLLLLRLKKIKVFLASFFSYQTHHDAIFPLSIFCGLWRSWFKISFTRTYQFLLQLNRDRSYNRLILIFVGAYNTSWGNRFFK